MEGQSFSRSPQTPWTQGLHGFPPEHSAACPSRTQDTIPPLSSQAGSPVGAVSHAEDAQASSHFPQCVGVLFENFSTVKCDTKCIKHT